uniref:Peptidase S54 rhomboid domain-containing protein n=1 Tax=Ditylenchus dipsaci TaxID=166011 RepID=A0A915E7H0_9BILA
MLVLLFTHSSISQNSIVGSSGLVYSLIGVHFIHGLLEFSSLQFYDWRLFGIMLALMMFDIHKSILYFNYLVVLSHLGGILAGMSNGILIFKMSSQRLWDRKAWYWTSGAVVLFYILGGAILLTKRNLCSVMAPEDYKSLDICQCQFQFSFLDSMTTRRVFVVQRSPAIAKYCYGIPTNSSDLGQFESAPIVIAGLPKTNTDRLFCRANCRTPNSFNDGMVYKASAGSWFETLTSPITAVTNAVNKGADTVQITVIIASVGMWSCCVIITIGILSLLHTCIREGRQDKLKRRKCDVDYELEDF